ncbi:MAG: thiamine phosphate synthase [Alphaproteobacteria bacterium]|nr:MAG: thiamine phosphate synthase [Alphaproteobacteria bacterium]
MSAAADSPAGRGEGDSPPACRLYLISPPAFAPREFVRKLERALAGGDVAAFQLRLKPASDEEVLEAGRLLMPICHAHDVAFIVNDRPDLAVQLGADGVHIGQSDMDVRSARRIVGHERDIGVTCHASRHLAYVAGEQGADYVAFGAFFPSPTKDSGHRADPELLRIWHETTEIPSVAIGGITAENCAPLVEAGADFLAVSSWVWRHPEGPARAVADLNRAIGKALARRGAEPS